MNREADSPTSSSPSLPSAFGKKRHQIGDLVPNRSLVLTGQVRNLRPDIAGQPLPKPVMRHFEGVFLDAQFARRFRLRHLAPQMRLVIFGMP